MQEDVIKQDLPSRVEEFIGKDLSEVETTLVAEVRSPEKRSFDRSR